MADTVSDRIVVAADPDTIMDVIGDLEAYPDWQDEVIDVEVLASDDDGWPSQARFTVDARITRATYTLAYTYGDTTVAWTLTASDALRRNDGSYELVAQPDGTTQVRYTLDIEPAIPVPGMLRRQFASRVADTALAGLKRRVESQPRAAGE